MVFIALWFYQWVQILINKMSFHSISTFLTLLSLLSLTTPWCYKSFVTIPGEATNIDLSPDNAYIAITAVNQNSIFILDSANYNLLLTYKPGSGSVVTAKFSSDGIYLGIAINNGTVNFISGRPTFSANVIFFINTAGTLTDIDFNTANTKLLACYSNGNQYNIYNNYTGVGTQTTTTVSISNNIIKCKFSQNDDVGYIDTNKNIKVYRPASAVSTSINNGAGNYKNFDFKPSNATPVKFIAGGHDSKSYYALDTNPPAMTVNSFTFSSWLSSGQMQAVCYAGDGQFYAFGGGSSDMRVFIFADNNTLYNVFSDSSSNLMSCIFTSDGEYLFVGTTTSSNLGYIHIYKRYCYQCALGYYFAPNTTCTLCNTAPGMLACASCFNSTMCTSCFGGYYLNHTALTCYKCDYAMEGCSTCVNSTFCSECNANYYLNSTNQCRSCFSGLMGCLTCNSSAYCLSCSPQYYNSSGACVRCNSIKPNCIRCFGNSSLCVQCQLGFYANSGSCIACNNNCTVCYSQATNCTACVRGFYVLAAACTPCTADCLQCNGTNFCFDCRMGTYSTATGTCSPCVYPCDTCNSTGCLNCVVGNYLSGTSCTSCATNCTTCTNSTGCLTCSLGYYLTAASACSSCRYLFNYCTTCSLTLCYSCDVGYYLLSNNTCTSCVSGGCIACNSNSFCQVCTLGYYLTSSNTCSACNSNCDTCYVSSTNCSSCIQGYYLSGSSCLACSSNCQTCNSTQCYSCNTAYYLTAGSCSSCKTALYGCLDCLNTTYCSQCQVGKYLNATSLCSDCSIGCGNCNSTVCFSCNVGYYLSSGSCSKCMDNCSECYSSTNCFSCNPGFYYNSSLPSSQCTQCASLSRGCLTCNSTVCMNCQPSYYLDSTTKLCIICSSSITHCLYCSSNAYCQACAQGFYLNAANNTCISCLSSIDGCESCMNSTQCQACSIGYYLNANSCSTCPSKCTTCNSSMCLTCSFRYTLSSGSCVACTNFIPHCEICNTTACLRCFEGFYLSAGTCVSCQFQMVGCQYCNASSTCTNCLDGYYLSGSACSLCSLIEGCTLCSSSSNCSDCSTGYVISGITCVLCQSLLPNCIFCSNSSNCVQCNSGYYLNGGSCSSCYSAIPECIYCSNGTQCTQCQGGFYLNNSTCSPCNVSGCEICTSLSPNQCINCYTGYYQSGNSCLSCNMAGCFDCTQANVCLSCQIGYYLSSNACYLCSAAISGCNKCSSSSVCTTCQTLYYLSGNTCTPCSGTLTGCAFCTNSSSCLSCNSGYYLNTSSLCSLCTSLPGCLLCKDMATCIYCTSEYYLSGGTCMSCSSITKCSQCSSSTACTACISGYVVSGGNCIAATASAGSSSSATPISTVTDLKWKSFYVSSTTLKHVLQAVGMTFTRVNATWNTSVQITILNKTTSILLTITSVEWGKANELIFYTNNPLTLSISTLPFVKRLLIGQSLNVNLNSSIQMSQPTLMALLPNLLVSNSLTLGYNLNDPEFYDSYISSVYNTYYYFIGIAVTCFLLLNFVIKALCTVTHSQNHGNIFGHIFALKAVSISLYPTFGEYINFSYGFMTADFPWLNAWIGENISDSSDYSPSGYLLYYSNMSLFSTYSLPIIVLLSALALSYLLLKNKKINKIGQKTSEIIRINQDRFKAMSDCLTNFFFFGMTFAGCASLQGSILNPNNIISLNGAGYVLGILLYMISAAICVNSFVREWNFERLRVFVKATLLSIAHFNPIYIFAVALATDIILMIIEVKVKQQYIISLKWFVVGQLLANFALSIVVYMPDSLIAIYLASSTICLVCLIQIYLHYLQKGIHVKDYPFFKIEQHKTNLNDSGGWRINMQDYSLEKQPSSQLNIIDKDLQYEKDHRINEDKQMNTRYTQFRETSNANKDKPNRRVRNFRDTRKSKMTILNSSWSDFDINT